MLFWAEGSKRTNAVIFTNSDADMVAFFLRFLRGCYGVRDDQVVLRIHCHTGNGLSVAEIERWWLDRLQLPPSVLRRTIVNRTSKASQRKGRTLLRGTAQLIVHSTHIVQSIYGALQEYAGMERPEWVEAEPRSSAKAARQSAAPAATH